MGVNELANCPQCNKLFVKGVQDLCRNCIKIEDQEYRLVAEYLRSRKNRKATIYECSEDTGVTINKISKFIRQKRITLENLPNMGYPCESCGALTRAGTLCQNCHQQLNQDIEKINRTEHKQSDTSRTDIKQTGYRRVKGSEV
ncbi:TIGR03826 family flagellar region protein [Caldalkalibacillus salinus]|uniref:TIGR03826 family flagellar region protein n=1 Tax=Caldalkalibacillus salinus TaxID=2803787 RepID=UPI00192054D5|nr:TIGR03826 family flagellar region protein [Caldalkalibacillus salinus]